MKALFMAVGTAHMGRTTRDEDGNIVERIPAHFDLDPEGGAIAIGKAIITGNVIQPDGPAEIFADWDAAGYMEKVVEILQPGRKLNIPDLREIIRTAAADGDDDFLCDRCKDSGSYACRDCIISQWRTELKDEAVLEKKGEIHETYPV